jgi:hypothetical protein
MHFRHSPEKAAGTTTTRSQHVFTITISNDAGASVTADNAEDLYQFLIAHLEQRGEPTDEAIDAFMFNLQDGHVAAAGQIAYRLGFNFAFSVPRPVYIVPTDPADETMCEACQ